MQLYIKQKAFSLKDKFGVKDQTGRDCYYIEGEMFTLGKKLHVRSVSGAEVLFVKQKAFSLMPKFNLYRNGQQIAEVEKEFTFFHPKYVVKGIGWEIEGNFGEHDYQIKKSNMTIATIHKEWMTWGDCYKVNIVNQNDEILVLGIVLAIDCVLEDDTSTLAATT